MNGGRCMKPYTLNEELKIREKINWRYVFICAFCVGWLIGFSLQCSYASGIGGQIIDKLYQPSRIYLVEYHDKETEITSKPRYEFLVMENKDECYIIKVDKKTYLKYNIGEEYYRCEDD